MIAFSELREAIEHSSTEQATSARRLIRRRRNPALLLNPALGPLHHSLRCYIGFAITGHGPAKMIRSLHHVQLAMPRGREADARAFYCDVLGMTEQPKPEHLARRGGAWFSAGEAQVHLGVEDDFRPAKKAHPALLVSNLRVLLQRCADAGVAVKSDEPLPGYDRAYVDDPFGNRIELLEPQAG